MYQDFFGFRERPFQLVPNPAYLFLSRSHEEAMAHLTYALLSGDGFIAITGEVGTGKTTLCRAFIEKIDERCEVAYIFNPKLSSVELLQSICDEFGIDTTAKSTAKEFIDSLNRFLMEKKAEKKQVMLIIDEAQNLSGEVLEQIRLLSNLETNTEKLFQIVLVGQPELENLLASYGLRQLNQRIALHCRLSPLTYDETVRYIRHRIHIAAPNNGIDFSGSAFRSIFAFSRGIPRLIHVVCDRALLTAFGKERRHISGGIVASAIRELNRGGYRLRTVERQRAVLLILLLCAVAALLVSLKPERVTLQAFTDIVARLKETASPRVCPSSGTEASAPSAVLQANDDPVPEEPAPDQASPAPETGQDSGASSPSSEADSSGNPAPETDVTSASPLAVLLSEMDGGASKESAISAVIALWERGDASGSSKETADPETYFRRTARDNGFQIHRMRGDLTLIMNLNLPAIFEFNAPGRKTPCYLALVRFSQSGPVFSTGAERGEVEATPMDLEGLWTGVVYIPWVNFYGYEGVTPISDSREGMTVLKRLLAGMGYDRLLPEGAYDSAAKAAIEDVQRKYGIPADGIVGALTKIALYNGQPGLFIPHLREKDQAAAVQASIPEGRR